MASQPTTLSPEELYKNFKDLVFDKFGKRLSDKDPLILQFLMQEMFAKNLSEQLAIFTTTSSGKLMDLADIWKKREDQSFESLNKAVNSSVEQIQSLILGDFKRGVAQVYSEQNEKVQKSNTAYFENMQKQLKLIGIVSVLTSLMSGLIIGVVIGKMLF